MKRFFTVIMVVLLAASFGYASELDDLRSQIEKLEKRVKQLDGRLSGPERHAATDTLSLSVELRSRVDSVRADMLALPAMGQDMMNGWMMGHMTDGHTVGQTATPDSIAWDQRNALDDYANNSVWGMLVQAGNTTLAAVPYADGAKADGWNDNFVTTYMDDFGALMQTTEISTMLGNMFTGLDAGTQGQYINNSITVFNNAMGAYGADAAPLAAMLTNPALTAAGYNAYKTDPTQVVAGVYDGTNQNEAMFYGMLDQLVNQMFGMDAFSGLMGDLTLTAQEAAMVKTAFSNMAPKKYEYTDNTFYTNKLRIRMSNKFSSKLSFSGRLLMYKTFGSNTNTRFFDGTFKSMSLDGNSGAVPGDDALHVERAYFVYKNDIADIPYSFSFGRRPAAYGYGYDNHENAPLGGSPVAHIIQWNFDGASLAFDLSELAGVEGLNWKLCYGRGFESDWGTYGAYTEDNLDDVDFYGTIIRFYDDEQYRLVYNYAKAEGITDGFAANTVMPFMVSGTDYDADGAYDTFSLTPNTGGFVSRFEPMTEIGDITMHALIAQGETAGVNWFASYATSKSDPTNQSKMAMMQFMGWDKLLGSTESETGTSIWVGAMTPELPGGGKLGVEYNQGSQYWFAFLEGEDHITQSKLATRGTATEVYYHQPIVGNKLLFTFGWLHIDNEYTGAGNPLAPAVKIDDATAMDTMLPVADVIDQYYFSMNYKF